MAAVTMEIYISTRCLSQNRSRLWGLPIEERVISDIMTHELQFHKGPDDIAITASNPLRTKRISHSSWHAELTLVWLDQTTTYFTIYTKYQYQNTTPTGQKYSEVDSLALHSLEAADYYLHGGKTRRNLFASRQRWHHLVDELVLK